MHHFHLFAKAIVAKWWTLMSCAVFTFLGLYALVFHKSNAWVITASIVAGLALFAWAAFLVWRTEYSARVTAESNIVRPKIDLSWGRRPSASNQDNHLIVENGSSIDAYDVQIHDVSLTPNLKGTFDPITRLKGNDSLAIDPHLTGLGIAQAPNKARDFEMILYSSGDLPPEYTKFTSTGNLAEIRCPLVVSFRDYGGNRYEASFEFVTDTLRYVDDIRFVKTARIG